MAGPGNLYRARKMEEAISALMQELIELQHPDLGTVAIAMQTLRSKPKVLARFHRHLEKLDEKD